MGEPAVPTEAERAATLELARRIVEAVRNDEESPIDIKAATHSPELIDGLFFRLAQDLVDTRRALDIACDTLRDLIGDVQQIDKLHRLDFDD